MALQNHYPAIAGFCLCLKAGFSWVSLCFITSSPFNWSRAIIRHLIHKRGGGDTDHNGLIVRPLFHLLAPFTTMPKKASGPGGISYHAAPLCIGSKLGASRREVPDLFSSRRANRRWRGAILTSSSLRDGFLCGQTGAAVCWSKVRWDGLLRFVRWPGADSTGAFRAAKPANKATHAFCETSPPPRSLRHLPDDL